MKELLLILLLCGCHIEKPFQVKEIILTLESITPASRDGEDVFWLNWCDDTGVEYSMYVHRHKYKVGDRISFLITR